MRLKKSPVHGIFGYWKKLINFPYKCRGWEIENGQLYCNRIDQLLDPVVKREKGWRLVVPSEYRTRVLRDAHCLPSIARIYFIAREYYWNGIFYGVVTFVEECIECQKYKILQKGQQGLMGKHIVERPCAKVAVDLMEFPPSKAHDKYLIVFQDLFMYIGTECGQPMAVG